MEALLAAAAAPVPPPACDLVPDATLADDLVPEDLPRLLELLGRADLYPQDEVEVALHPTLTRVWSRCGRPGQHLVQAPGTNAKQDGFGLVDWRDGQLDWAVARSQARGRIAMVILDNLGIHPPRGRGCCGGCWRSWASNWCWSPPPPMTRRQPDRVAVAGLAPRRHPHPPASDPGELVADADHWAHTITPA